MKELTLNIPGANSIQGPVNSLANTPFNPGDFSIGYFLSQLFTPILLIATFIAFLMLFWGGLRYLFAGGNKEMVAKARARITWALIGLVVCIASLLVANFVKNVLNPENVPLPTINKPADLVPGGPATVPITNDCSVYTSDQAVNDCNAGTFKGCTTTGRLSIKYGCADPAAKDTCVKDTLTKEEICGEAAP